MAMASSAALHQVRQKLCQEVLASSVRFGSALRSFVFTEATLIIPTISIPSAPEASWRRPARSAGQQHGHSHSHHKKVIMAKYHIKDGHPASSLTSLTSMCAKQSVLCIQEHTACDSQRVFN